MPEQSKAAVNINDFPGLKLDTDEFQIPPGHSPLQKNMTSEDLGRLQSRSGFIPVEFEDTVP